MLTKKLRSTLAVLFASLVLFSFTKPVYQTDFSGTWTLNESKSELGQMGRAAASKVVIEQKTEGITFTKTQAGFDGSNSNTTETLVDGKESETSVYNGSGKKKSTLKWAADANTFTVKSSISISANGQSFDIASNEAWSLSADGKTLTLANAISTPQGDVSVKCVYDKQ